jgi:pre-mRNA cleavage complex 2 protein Pcf11
MASESAEVAEDYRLALEDLSSNMRFEISNLTVIARENTEHALAIAEVLQQHILKVRPARTYRKGLPWRLAFDLS